MYWHHTTLYADQVKACSTRIQFYYLGLIVLMPLIGAIINGLLGAKLPRWVVNTIACGAILSSFIFSLVSIKALVDNSNVIAGETIYGRLTYTAYQWIYTGDFGVDIAFMVDPLTALLLLADHWGWFFDPPLLGRIHGA